MAKNGKIFMISQPMRGKTDEEILEIRNSVKNGMEAMGFRFMDTFFEGYDANSDPSIKSVPLFFLSKSIERMSKCDVVVFVDGWENTRGCLVEHAAAKEYGLEIYLYNPNREQAFTKIN